MSPIIYTRRQPEKTVLYQAVLASWLSLTTQCESSDWPLPSYVEKEVDAYLRCGILAYGFARIHCKDCGHDRLVAFSCKGRNWCPSCGGRFMADKAAHLVDNVLPKASYRQWVLTLPPPLRYMQAYDSALCSDVLGCFWKTVCGWLKHKAKKEFGLTSLKQAYPGGLTVIQRCGSALNLNPHFHLVATDGVFIQTSPESTPVFRALPAPTDAEVAQVAWLTCQGTLAILRKQGRWLDEEFSDDKLAQEEPALAAFANASIQGTLVLGPRSGKRVVKFFGVAAKNDDQVVAIQTPGYGFNLHAKRRVSAHDRKGLERLCRYILRPPIANDRLSRLSNGKISLKLKRPWSDGTTHIIFTDEELMEKLISLIFPPRFNRIRYHGVFAPRSNLRDKIIPQSCDEESSCDDTAHKKQEQHVNKSRRIEWAKLLARVFELDVLQCPKCKSRMQRIAFITQGDVIKKILDCVGLPADSPQPRPPPQLSLAL